MEDIVIADYNSTPYVLKTGVLSMLRFNDEKLFDVVRKHDGDPDYFDGIGFAARLNYPTTMKLFKLGNIYFVDDKLGF